MCRDVGTAQPCSAPGGPASSSYPATLGCSRGGSFPGQQRGRQGVLLLGQSHLVRLLANVQGIIEGILLELLASRVDRQTHVPPDLAESRPPVAASRVWPQGKKSHYAADASILLDSHTALKWTCSHSHHCEMEFVFEKRDS